MNEVALYRKHINIDIEFNYRLNTVDFLTFKDLALYSHFNFRKNVDLGNKKKITVTSVYVFRKFFLS